MLLGLFRFQVTLEPLTNRSKPHEHRESSNQGRDILQKEAPTPSSQHSTASTLTPSPGTTALIVSRCYFSFPDLERILTYSDLTTGEVVLNRCKRLLVLTTASTKCAVYHKVARATLAATAIRSGVGTTFNAKRTRVSGSRTHPA